MFLVLQFPFTDARPFLPTTTNRLPNPVWASPQQDKDFVRSFGEIKRRIQGGLEEWPNEGFYCRAEHALRFDSSFGKRQTIDGAPVPFTKYCSFRRFLSDGCSVSRVETGIRFRSKGKDLRYTGDQCLSVIRSVLSQPTTVVLESKRYPEQFAFSQQNLSKLYLKSSTTRVGSPANPKNWWFAPGTPLVVLEYVKGADLKELPKYIRPVQSEVLTDAQIDLSYTSVKFGEKEIGAWLLGIAPFGTDTAVRRSLRLNLLRFHAEMESIRQIFRLIASEKITISRGDASSDKLQTYLHKSIRLLSRESRDGLPQSKILEIAQQQLDNIIDVGERKSLLEQLSAIRKNYFLSVKKFTEPKGTSHREPIYELTAETINIIYGGNQTVTNQTQNVYGNVTGNINQAAAKNIRESFNITAESGSSPELKKLLDELGGSVMEMAKSLPEAEQKKAARDYKSLVEETTSEEPRKEWYELSAKGLTDAAKTVGEIATPVITVVKMILALFA